jgi:hypothetical protein
MSSSAQLGIWNTVHPWFVARGEPARPGSDEPASVQSVHDQARFSVVPKMSTLVQASGENGPTGMGSPNSSWFMALLSAPSVRSA